MKLGVVVRDDNGGLGNLTYDVFRYLRPEVTLVVQSRPCRGEPHPSLFEEAWTTVFRAPNPVPDEMWEWAGGQADVWWSAETWYNDNAERILRDAGKRTVLYAMPELFAGSHADEVWNPTNYLSDRGRLGDVMQWPCDPPETWQPKTKVRRILHITSGAAGDRNGSQTFLQALRQLSVPADVIVHDPDRMLSPRDFMGLPENVSCRHINDYADSMGAFYRWADLLVLPRRYAGLCLPAFEAFGHGCIVMMPDVDPQVYWPIVGVKATAVRPLRMKGGKVPTWDVDPQVLADRIEAVMDATVRQTVDLSSAGRQWAEVNSWANANDKWKERLCK